MSATAAATNINTKPVFQKMRLKARIDAFRLHEGVYYTTVTCPAIDEFSKPSRFEVRSKQKVGEVGEICDFDCHVVGWANKPYTFTDKQTGEVKSVTKMGVALDVIEQG